MTDPNGPRSLKAVAKNEAAPNPVQAFKGYLERQKGAIAAALPGHLSPERMIRLATTVFAGSKDLQECTAPSIYGAIIQASQLGLEIGVLGQAYLVPHKDKRSQSKKAVLIIGYKGLISLARRTGEISSIESHIVYENDDFDMELGLETRVKHRPNLDGNRGRPRLVYGVAHFKDGSYHFEWMSIAEVEKIKARSRSGDSGPWVTDYDQMVRKTLIRRMCNYLPMSVELQNAVTLSDAQEQGKSATIEGDVVVISEEPGHDEDDSTQREQIADQQPKPDVASQRDVPEDAQVKPAEAQAKPAEAQPRSDADKPVYTYEKVLNRLENAQTMDDLDEAADLIGEVGDGQQRTQLSHEYMKLRRARDEAK